MMAKDITLNQIVLSVREMRLLQDDIGRDIQSLLTRSKSFAKHKEETEVSCIVGIGRKRKTITGIIKYIFLDLNKKIPVFRYTIQESNNKFIVVAEENIIS